MATLCHLLQQFNTETLQVTLKDASNAHQQSAIWGDFKHQLRSFVMSFDMERKAYKQKDEQIQALKQDQRLLMDQIDELKRRQIAFMSQKQDEHKHALEAKNSEFASIQSELNVLRQEKAIWAGEQSKHTSKMDSLKVELDQATMLHSIEKGKVAKLEQMIASRANELDERKAILEEQLKLKEEFESSFQILQRKLLEQQAETERINQNYSRAQVVLAQEREKHAKELEAIGQQQSELKDTIASLELTNKTMQQHLSKSQSLEEEIGKEREANKQQLDKYTQLKEVIQQSDKMISLQRQKIDQLFQDNTNARAILLSIAKLSNANLENTVSLPMAADHAHILVKQLYDQVRKLQEDILSIQAQKMDIEQKHKEVQQNIKDSEFSQALKLELQNVISKMEIQLSEDAKARDEEKQRFKHTILQLQLQMNAKDELVGSFQAALQESRKKTEASELRALQMEDDMRIEMLKFRETIEKHKIENQALQKQLAEAPKHTRPLSASSADKPISLQNESMQSRKSNVTKHDIVEEPLNVKPAVNTGTHELDVFLNHLTTQMVQNKSLEETVQKLVDEKNILKQRLDSLAHNTTLPQEAALSLRSQYENELEKSNEQRKKVEHELEKRRHQLDLLMRKYKSMKDKYFRQSLRQNELQNFLLKMKRQSGEFAPVPPLADSHQPEEAAYEPPQTVATTKTQIYEADVSSSSPNQQQKRHSMQIKHARDYIAENSQSRRTSSIISETSTDTESQLTTMAPVYHQPVTMESVVVSRKRPKDAALLIEVPVAKHAKKKQVPIKQQPTQQKRASTPISKKPTIRASSAPSRKSFTATMQTVSSKAKSRVTQ